MAGPSGRPYSFDQPFVVCVRKRRRHSPCDSRSGVLRQQTLEFLLQRPRSASLTFLPNHNQSIPNAPVYRAFAGRTVVGAAWEKTSENTGRTYYSVRLDDPTFAAPFSANLIKQDEGGFVLIWSRPQRRDWDARERRARPAASTAIKPPQGLAV